MARIYQSIMSEMGSSGTTLEEKRAYYRKRLAALAKEDFALPKESGTLRKRGNWMNRIFGAAGLMVVSLLILIALFGVLPVLVNKGGWIGFFGAPVVALIVVALLIKAIVFFVNKLFKQGNEKNEKTI